MSQQFYHYGIIEKNLEIDQNIMLTVNDLKNKIDNALAGQPEASIYLFGSYARNEQKPESDVDLLVVAQKKNDAKNIVHDLYKKLSDIEIDYDILGYSFSSLKRKMATNIFLKRIIDEGIVLYGKRI